MKVHVISDNGGHLQAPHDSWKDWIHEWVPDDMDIIVEAYDPTNSDSSRGSTGCISISRVRTNGELASVPNQRPQPIRPQLSRFSQRTTASVDPLTARRIAARESFNRQVQEVRNHTADILSKLGNGRK